MEMPTTVETVEAAIKKHKDFTTTMELNLHRIKAVIEAGESLISQNNIYSERIRERVDTLANRCPLPPPFPPRYTGCPRGFKKY